MSQWRSQKQERGDLARVLRAEGKTWVEIAERFRLRYRVNSRVALRWAHGWSQQQAANKWNERWPDDRKTFKNFSYWEVWPSNTGYAPSLDVLNRLAQLYECSVSDVVVDLPDYRHRDKAHDGTWLPGHGGEVGEHYVSPVPKRREMLGYLGAGLMAVGLEQLISTAQQGGLPRVLHALEMTRQTRDGLDTTAMESLSDLVEHYRRRFRSTPPAELYGEILSVRIYASSLLAGRSAPSKLPDVLVAAGWLSNLLALVTLDLGDHAAALVWCADAERRSRETGLPELAGWALDTRALMSFYNGRAREAVAHAREGQARTPLGTVAHAKLAAHEMRAWALLGNAEATLGARRRAEKAIAKLPADTLAHGAFSISRADDPPYTATSLLLLGRFQEAEEMTRQVIAASGRRDDRDGPEEHPSAFARAHLVLGLALAGLGRLEEAHDAGTVALDTPRLVWPTAVLAGKLDRALMRDFGDTPLARDYHQRCVTVVQQSEPQPLAASGEVPRPTIRRS